MVIRIRLTPTAQVRHNPRKKQEIALGTAALLTPAAVMTVVLAFWRIAADAKATAQFPITNGFFSHWQVWMALAAFLQLCAILLNRYGKPSAMLQETIDESS